MEHGSGLQSSVLRTLDILEALTRSGATMTLADLAAQTATPKGTLHRLLQSLQSRGYVTQDGVTGRYAAGLRCFELGSLWAQNLDLRSTAAPFLARLNVATRETVHLGVYEHGDVVYIDRLESPQQVIAKSYVGRRCPATCVATGRVLLAFSDLAEIDRVLGEPLPAYTAHSITDRDELAAMLNAVRADGFGVNRCSYRDEVSGIAAPIRDHTGRVVASVGLCLPDHRLGGDRVELLRDATIETALEISRALGGSPPVSWPGADAHRSLSAQTTGAGSSGGSVTPPVDEGL
ncbi:MAG: IclR family transcriptional regulator [Modestobacter sp.]|jgi:DNA-binding IclR family transcriptional regulator|nr:IclR family transcriptional regulator [Modestobacter sp.]